VIETAHPAAAAAGRRLDDDRIADLAREPRVLLRVVGQRPVRARHARHPARPHRLDRRHLVAHQADRLRSGADEHEPALFDALREVGVLGQEAVARVDRDRIRDLRGRDDRGHVEIALL